MGRFDSHFAHPTAWVITIVQNRYLPSPFMETRALGRLGTECWDYDCMKVLMLTIYPYGVYVNTRRGYLKTSGQFSVELCPAWNLKRMVTLRSNLRLGK